jgi:hypothetical protein
MKNEKECIHSESWLKGTEICQECFDKADILFTPPTVKEESFSDFIRSPHTPEKEKIMMDVIKGANEEQKKLMSVPLKDVKTEWRKFCFEDDNFESFDIRYYEERIAEWWIEKLATAVKRAREEDVGKIEKMKFTDKEMVDSKHDEDFYYKHGYNEAIKDILSLLKEE